MTDTTALVELLLDVLKSKPCPQPTPFVNCTQPTCKRDAGHPPPHQFTAFDPTRTDLEQFPTAKEAPV